MQNMFGEIKVTKERCLNDWIKSIEDFNHKFHTIIIAAQFIKKIHVIIHFTFSPHVRMLMKC